MLYFTVQGVSKALLARLYIHFGNMHERKGGGGADVAFSVAIHLSKGSATFCSIVFSSKVFN